MEGILFFSLFLLVPPLFDFGGEGLILDVHWFFLVIEFKGKRIEHVVGIAWVIENGVLILYGMWD